jgi:hypothetical protein
MTGKNKILIGCLALLLVLSVGYALFSETVQINGTATAKGEFDISYTCEIVTEDNATIDNSYTKGGKGECKIENGIIKTNSTLYKPGDEVYFRVNITNSGTIPAKLVTVDSSNNYAFESGWPNGAGDEVYFDPTYSLLGLYVLEDTNTGGDSTLEQMELVLQPKQTESAVILHGWSWINEKQPPKEGVIMNYNISLGFEQVAN